ncbi:MAG: leucine-rich repeat domain-containing protein [Rivularia sp. ALOHA_DT_140]|nr:leucine-rich repeat domain-containing protein [Rivularia sp. ALOHA_DT_140]
MKKIIISVCAILTLTACNKVKNPNKTFSQWCQEKSTLPPETQHTIEVLLKEAGTDNCEIANKKLKKLTRIYLSSKQISDLKPLASLTNLNVLFLNRNKITDIKPLENLTNLKRLYLGGNKLSNLKPLAYLTNLTHLELGLNKITDINPLFP